MNKIWLIMQREFLNRVQKKSFLITTILVPLIFPAIIDGHESKLFGVFKCKHFTLINNLNHICLGRFCIFDGDVSKPTDNGWKNQRHQDGSDQE